MSVTFDHRYLDGVHAAALARKVRAVVEDPRAHLGPPEVADAQPGTQGFR